MYKINIKLKAVRHGYIMTSVLNKPTLLTKLGTHKRLLHNFDKRYILLHGFDMGYNFTGRTLNECVAEYLPTFISTDTYCFAEWHENIEDYPYVSELIFKHKVLYEGLRYLPNKLLKAYKHAQRLGKDVTHAMEMEEVYTDPEFNRPFNLDGEFKLVGGYLSGFPKNGKGDIYDYNFPWLCDETYELYESGRFKNFIITIDGKVAFRKTFARPTPKLHETCYTSEKIEAVLDFETVEVLSTHESYDCSNIVLISISDPDDRSSKHKVTTKFKKVHELSFTDATYFNEGQVKFQQLQYLKDFILENKDEKFMINCVAGSRRSAAITAYLEVLLGLTKTLQTSKVWKMWRYEQNQLHIDRINKFMETEFVNEDVWKMHIETGATGVCESHWGHYLGHEHSEVKWTNSSLRLYRGSHMPLEVELNDLGGLFYLI